MLSSKNVFPCLVFYLNLNINKKNQPFIILIGANQADNVRLSRMSPLLYLFIDHVYIKWLAK